MKILLFFNVTRNHLRLQGLKLAITIMFAASVGLYFVKASDYSKPNLPETSDSEQAGSCDNEAVINPCEDLSNWLSRAGPVSGYHVCASFAVRYHAQIHIKHFVAMIMQVLCVASNGQALTVYLRGKDSDATTRTLTNPEVMRDVAECMPTLMALLRKVKYNK